MSALKSFFKDTVIYGVASVMPRLINFALIGIYTSVFDTTQFSSQTKWYIYAAFINVILTLGIETSFFRFYTSEPDKEKVISNSFLLLMAASLLFLFSGLLASVPLTVFFDFPNDLFLEILIWVTVLDTISVIPFALLRVSGRPFRFMFLKVSNVVFLAVITILLLIIVPAMVKYDYGFLIKIGITKDYSPDIIHLFIANVAASLFTFCCLLPEIIKIKWSLDLNIVKRLLNYGLPIMVGGLAFVINENIDKLIIPSFINEDANGIYSACYKLGVFMTLYITAFRMGAEPFFFNHANTVDAKEKYSKIMTWFVVFGSLFMLLVVCFLDLIAGVFLRQAAYLDGLIIVPVILLANLFSGIYNNLSIWYKLTDRTRFGMYISIFGALLTIGSLLLFLPMFGMIGGAIATLFTYFLMALISWYIGRKYYQVPYDVIKIIVIILCSSLLSFVSFYWLRGNIFYNIAVILLFCSFIYFLEKDNVKKLLASSSN